MSQATLNIAEKKVWGKEDIYTLMEHGCPNKVNHVSAWPGTDRMICPVCLNKYVRKA